MAAFKTPPSIGRRRLVNVAAGLLGAAQFGGDSSAHAQGGRASRLPVEGEMPPLAGATAWINTPPLTLADLRGKVVLVEFWTYTCINWLRSHAYIRAWTEKYQDRGLTVIGVHTPEFPFEADIRNVQRAARDMKIGYPIAVDSEYAIWRAFQNEYWPAFYFVDAQGRIRHHQFGEGGYEKSEAVIQQLLSAVQSDPVGSEPVSAPGRGIEAAADWADLRSPESYVGYERAENFSSPGGAVPDRPGAYTAPARLSLNHWAVAGDWTMAAGFAASDAANGRIIYRFHARDLHLVMGGSPDAGPVRCRVRIDGAPPAADHGLDVDAEGWGDVREPRLYQLVRQSRAIADRTFEIEFLDPGARVYAFTFG